MSVYSSLPDSESTPSISSASFSSLDSSISTCIYPDQIIRPAPQRPNSSTLFQLHPTIYHPTSHLEDHVYDASDEDVEHPRKQHPLHWLKKKSGLSRKNIKLNVIKDRVKKIHKVKQLPTNPSYLDRQSSPSKSSNKQKTHDSDLEVTSDTLSMSSSSSLSLTFKNKCTMQSDSSPLNHENQNHTFDPKIPISFVLDSRSPWSSYAKRDNNLSSEKIFDAGQATQTNYLSPARIETETFKNRIEASTSPINAYNQPFNHCPIPSTSCIHNPHSTIFKQESSNVSISSQSSGSLSIPVVACPAYKFTPIDPDEISASDDEYLPTMDTNNNEQKSNSWIYKSNSEDNSTSHLDSFKSRFPRFQVTDRYSQTSTILWNFDFYDILDRLTCNTCNLGIGDYR